VGTDALSSFERDGFVFLEGVFSADEVAVLRAAVPPLFAERTERTVYEVDGTTIRSVYGPHQRSKVFADLARHPRLVQPAQAVLGRAVYVYQSKINTKAVFGSDVWPWHQDYIFWWKEDGMPAPRALTIGVFLDDITEASGPMSLVPSSHKNGVVATDSYEGRPSGYEQSPSWIANLVARLKYTISKDVFVELASKHGIVTPMGPAGSILVFDCNVAHASSVNLSPNERRMAFITYNAVDNAPSEAGLRRPEFLVSRDVAPVIPVADDVLRNASTSSV
jgi:ectoine hydroxylase